jgi:MinD-like ATPase involved in chromosome partitioning or flagellar assembly
VEQGEQEYPPGTVGYLAQGLGWRTVASREPVPEDFEEPESSEWEYRREPRLATPVPEQQPGSVEPHDVHTDEDDELDSELDSELEFDDEMDGDLDERRYPGHDEREHRAGGIGRDSHQDVDPPYAGHPQVRNSLFEDFTYDPDDDLDPDGELSAGGVFADGEAGDDSGVSTGPVEPGPERAHLEDNEDYPEHDQRYPEHHENDPGQDGGGRAYDHGSPEHAEDGSTASDADDRPVDEAGSRAGATAAGMAAAAVSTAAEPRSAGRWTEPGAVAAQQAQRAREGELTGPDGELASARLLRQTRRPPRSGWRRALYVVSGRTVNLGEGRADQNERELITRVNKPLHGCYKIAMLSLKGGVGKTTVTATLGATFASLRGDRVIAVDANPDRGTLSQKIPLETSATVRHLLRDAQRVRRYTDVRAYTSQGPSRLEVLASEQDPAVSEAFSEAEYRRTVNLLEHFYNVVLTDCGTGLMHSAMYGVLGLADALVIVSSGSIDGARSASATMDWLDAHGHGDLVANSVAVINSVRRNSGGVDLDRVAEHFAARCRKVIRVPFDSHLEEGAEIDLDRLSPHTRAALLELAASVADNFPSSAP